MDSESVGFKSFELLLSKHLARLSADVLAAASELAAESSALQVEQRTASGQPEPTTPSVPLLPSLPTSRIEVPEGAGELASEPSFETKPSPAPKASARKKQPRQTLSLQFDLGEEGEEAPQLAHQRSVSVSDTSETSEDRTTLQSNLASGEHVGTFETCAQEDPNTLRLSFPENSMSSGASFRAYRSTMRHERAFGSSLASGAFMLSVWSEWQTQSSLLRKTLSSGAATRSGQADVFVEGIRDEARTTWGDTLQNSERESRCIFHPDRTFRLSWTAVGGVLVGYDVVTIPLAVFPDLIAAIGSIMKWVTAVWWALDVIVNFVSGFHDHGLVELRPSRIASNYLRTWFAIDALICTSDWMALILDVVVDSTGTQDGLDVFGMGKAMRTGRMIRVVRLVRFYKVSHLVTNMMDRLPSANLVAVAKMWSLVAAVLLISHYVACTWYLLGSSYEHVEATWTNSDALIGADSWHLYAMALHWSLTQYTPAPMDLAPHNVQERFFAIAVVLSALVVFSSFVATLSAKITEVRQLKAERLASEARVREYLSSKRISVKVGHSIWAFLRAQKKTMRRPLCEADVILLRDIPVSLRMELRTHVYFSSITFHPLFLILSQLAVKTIVAICYYAMSESFYLAQQDVFVEGEEATQMFFVTAGEGEYQTVLYSEPCAVKPGSLQACVSEAVLWGAWIHCGQFVAQRPMEIAAMHAGRFRRIMTETHVHQASVVGLRKYAALFGGLVRCSDDGTAPITDLILEDAVTRRMVDRTLATKSYGIGKANWMTRMSQSTVPQVSGARQSLSSLWG